MACRLPRVERKRPWVDDDAVLLGDATLSDRRSHLDPGRGDEKKAIGCLSKKASCVAACMLGGRFDLVKSSRRVIDRAAKLLRHCAFPNGRYLPKEIELIRRLLSSYDSMDGQPG